METGLAGMVVKQFKVFLGSLKKIPVGSLTLREPLRQTLVLGQGKRSSEQRICRRNRDVVSGSAGPQFVGVLLYVLPA